MYHTLIRSLTSKGPYFDLNGSLKGPYFVRKEKGPYWVLICFSKVSIIYWVPCIYILKRTLRTNIKKKKKIRTVSTKIITKLSIFWLGVYDIALELSQSQQNTRFCKVHEYLFGNNNWMLEKRFYSRFVRQSRKIRVGNFLKTILV